MDIEEKLIKIYEGPVPEDDTKILLQELLEENNIPYRGDIEGYWTGVRVPKYNEKFVIYVEPKFKLQAEKYIEEINNEDNILTDDIEELQTNENTEVEAKNFAKKQKIMQRVLIGIVVAMVVSIMIAGIFAG